MPRRKRLPPDTRLDWRDPDMPVLRRFEHPLTGKAYMDEVSPEDETDFHAEAMRYGIHSDNSDYDLAAKTKAQRRRRLQQMMEKKG